MSDYNLSGERFVRGIWEETRHAASFLSKPGERDPGGFPRGRKRGLHWEDGHFDVSGFREGDIIFQSSLSSQSKAIELATHSRYSHCGIVLKIGKQFYVYEAVGPVRYLPLQEWIALGKGGRYALKRLKNADTILTAEAIGKIRKAGEYFKGKPYDSTFGWGDERIYCSELVHKIYSRALGLEVGKIRRLGDFDLTHPSVREELRERYGENIPLNEPVVSPQDVFESDLLVSVGGNGR